MRDLPGRGAESTRLVAACRRAATGAGGLALITGEAGIGKSALARFAVDAAHETGLTVGQGWCVDDPGAPPLWPWRRAAQRMDGLRAALLATPDGDTVAAGRWQLAEAVLAALTEPPTGRLVVLEDLHWADAATLDLLTRLLPELGQLPVLVLGTARHEHLSGTPLGDALPGLLRGDRTEHLPLDGLDAADTAAWLGGAERTRAWSRHAGELVARTGGNPFLIGTLVAELDVGDDVAQALARRPAWRTVLTGPYRRLPAPVRETVATAAVMGERLTPALLAAAVRRPAAEVGDHLAAAVAAGVLESGPAGLAFHHALVRDAVVADLGPAELDRAHAGAATALEASGDPSHAGPAAVHWSRVAGPAAAARCRDLAGSAVRDHHRDPVRAGELARLGLAAARALGATDGELAEWELQVARAAWAAGAVGEALETCAAGLDHAEAGGRPELAADLALVPQGVGSSDVSAVVGALCRRALLALPEEEVARRSRLLAVCAVAAAETEQDAATAVDRSRTGGSARELSARALAEARRSGDPQAELEAVAARHFVLSDPGTIEERTGLAARAVELAASSPTTAGALWGHLWQADLGLQRGDLPAVELAVADLERVARRRGSPVARWHLLRIRAAVALLAGEFDAARGTAAEARAIADRVGDVSMVGMHHAFHVHLAMVRGDPADVLHDTVDLVLHSPPIPLVRALVPQVLSLRGDADGARAALVPLRGVPAATPLGPRWLGTVGQIGWAAVAVGDREVAAECHRLLRPTARWCGGDGGGSPVALGSNEHPVGRLAQTAGELGTAAAHLSRGVAVDDRLGARPSAALGRVALAECLATTDPGRAAALAVVAQEECRRLDMPGPCARAGAVVGRLRQGRPGNLSAREHEVALLVSRGWTNQQIADRLVLSVRTVESHVRNALVRLGLHNRTELAAWLADDRARRP